MSNDTKKVKTIQINPNYLQMAGSKTRKSHDKITRTKPVPLISPNTLKNKLLKRIKEHKSAETAEKISLEKNTHRHSTHLKKEDSKDIGKYTDEFYQSIDYLTNLSKKHKKEGDKLSYEKQQRRKREQLHNQTIKKPISIPSQHSMQNVHVELELPEELKEPMIAQASSQTFKLNNMRNVVKDDIPYGCLKGGVKPCYKSWSKTQKNGQQIQQSQQLQPIQQTNPMQLQLQQIQQQLQQSQQLQLQQSQQLQQLQQSQSQQSQQSQQSTQLNSLTREERLQLIKNKIQNLEINDKLKPEKQELKEDPELVDDNLELVDDNLELVDDNLELNLEKSEENDNTFVLTDLAIENIGFSPSKMFIKHNKEEESKLPDATIEILIPRKKIIKKTIRRKHTVGKSTIYKKVGILLKDKHTRKKVIAAHKELKKKPINEIKKYLREQCLLRVGSIAPPNVLRKTYECAMLSGEIRNTNKDTLIHNFLNNPDENL